MNVGVVRPPPGSKRQEILYEAFAKEVVKMKPFEARTQRKNQKPPVPVIQMESEPDVDQILAEMACPPPAMVLDFMEVQMEGPWVVEVIDIPDKKKEEPEVDDSILPKEKDTHQTPGRGIKRARFNARRKQMRLKKFLAKQLSVKGYFTQDFLDKQENKENQEKN